MGARPGQGYAAGRRAMGQDKGGGASDMTWEEREMRSLGNSSAAQEEPPISDELRQQIEAARAGLGQTDGKAGQAKQKLVERKEQTASKIAQVREKVTAAAPGQARNVLAQVQQKTSERPVPVAFLVGLITGLFIGRKK
jgi:ElaB/YqjD/DUF883 family membrane-anchored ribosome-binding protein